MKKQRLFISIILSQFLCIQVAMAQQTFYVSPGGSGAGRGTLKNPYTSIARAVSEVSRVNKKMSGDIIVYIRGGTYLFSSPLVFIPENSGMNGFNIIYKAYQDEKPVLSGGLKVSGWEKERGDIYKANLNRNVKLRSLFVNGKRMRMAGTGEGITGLGSWGSYEVKGTEPWALGAGTAIDGIRFSASDIGLFKNPDDLELVQFRSWTEKILCARDMEKKGDTIIVKLQQPYGAIATNLAWAGRIAFNGSFLVRNAYELLDSPGEFYFDKSEQILYYYSQGEDMSTAEVIVPASEGLIRMHGASTDSRVQNIRFEGITFCYDDWGLMEVEQSGAFAGIQSLGMAVKYIPDGNWHPTEYNSVDLPAGTIDLKNCSDIQFIRNRFEHIGSAISISMVNDVINSDVTGNYFFDMLGNAVSIGHPQHYKIGDGGIYKQGTEGVCKNINVSNNYIRCSSLDFRQVEAITAYFVENVKLDHNDISGTPYGAIACGWWWGNSEIPPSTVAKNNSMSYNRAGNTHIVLDDGGILYALGEQPNTIITGNYLFNGPRCIYPDDGSAYLKITENAIRNPTFSEWLFIWSPRCHDNIIDRNYVHDNLAMDNGTNDKLQNTTNFRLGDFSGEAAKIVSNAGIEEHYKDIIPQKEPETISLHPVSFRVRSRMR